jgi:quercetin dioxygenase-like cupin family protein
MADVKLFDVNEAEWTAVDNGARLAVFHASDQLTIQTTEVMPERAVPAHHHPAGQVIYVLRGNAEITVDGNPYVLGPGCCCSIPSEAVHGVRNIGTGTCVILDIFTPARLDRKPSRKKIDLGHHWE